MFNIHPASVYGFCKGVESATKQAITLTRTHHDGPLYSIGRLVHNERVCKSLEDAGMRVVMSPGDAEPGTALVRAHGIPVELWKEFEDAGYTLVDGTCRLVAANHRLCERLHGPVLFFGIKGHAETVSTVSHIKVGYKVIQDEEDLDGLDPDALYDVVVQTTFSSSKQERFCKLLDERGIRYRVRNSICAASSRRRQAVKDLCQKCDLVLILGEAHSANTNELYRIAQGEGVRSYMVASCADVTDEMLAGAHDVGVSAGASAAPRHVTELIRFLEAKGGVIAGAEADNSDDL